MVCVVAPYQTNSNLSVILIPKSPSNPSPYIFSQTQDVMQNVDETQEAKNNLLEFSGLSSPTSPSSDVGTALATWVYNHITRSLSQWIASVPSSSGVQPDIQISVCHLKASAR